MNKQRNEEAYQAYWEFVNERHRIYLKKEAGEPKPWTDNPIYRDNKLCNVFRKLDKQSQWLIKHVIESHWKNDQALMLFNIFAFRAFNWAPTYEALRKDSGHAKQTWLADWDIGEVKEILKEVSETGKLTSGAYMIRGLNGIHKWESIAHTLDIIWDRKDKLLWDIQQKDTLENAYNQILHSEFWGWGPFTSYQVALDLTYSPILQNPPDINTWCEFGPGAKKGLREIWPDIPMTHEWLLEGAKYLLVDQVKYREPHVPELNLQDCEFVLCESSKIARIKAGGHAKEHYEGKE